MNANHILWHGEPLHVRGVVYVPGYPGFLPWEIEQKHNLPDKLTDRMQEDLRGIAEMGANTIRLWGAPAICYEILREHHELAILQTIWIDPNVPDFQDEACKSQVRAYIRTVVDRVHGVFRHDPPVLGYLLGNELSRESILSTDSAYPEIHSYTGNHIRMDSNRTASECFLAEMADYLIEYSVDTYQFRPLVSYANDIRTSEILQTPFLDFQSQNTYSYAVPYYRPEQTPGSATGTLFQGWLETVRALHPDHPLLVTETGLSVCPQAPHRGPPNYGYGGNTEREQASGILQNLTDIETAAQPIAGVIIHEYLDAWWKSGLADSYLHEPDDVEEWFGLVALQPQGDWYTTIPRTVYYALKSQWSEVNN